MSKHLDKSRGRHFEARNYERLARRNRKRVTTFQIPVLNFNEEEYIKKLVKKMLDVIALGIPVLMPDEDDDEIYEDEGEQNGRKENY